MASEKKKRKSSKPESREEKAPPAVLEPAPEPGETGGGSTKKHRKRLKGLYKRLAEQLEFYFSDANLRNLNLYKNKQKII